MRKLTSFWRFVVFDSLGVLFILLSILTGWLPGPGGIPLFIIGLSMLAVNHTWARRYTDLLKKYAYRLGDLVFVANPKIQLAYDITAPFLVAVGLAVLITHHSLWVASISILCIFLGITIFLGNRRRWQKLKQAVLKKS